MDANEPDYMIPETDAPRSFHLPLFFCFLRAYDCESIRGKVPKEMIKADSLDLKYLSRNSFDTRLSSHALKGYATSLVNMKSRNICGPTSP